MDVTIEKATSTFQSERYTPRDKLFTLRFLDESIRKIGKRIMIMIIRHKSLLKILFNFLIYDKGKKDPFFERIFGGNPQDQDGSEYCFFFYRFLVKCIRKWNIKYGSNSSGKSTQIGKGYAKAKDNGVKFDELSRRNEKKDFLSIIYN